MCKCNQDIRTPYCGKGHCYYNAICKTCRCVFKSVTINKKGRSDCPECAQKKKEQKEKEQEICETCKFSRTLNKKNYCRRYPDDKLVYEGYWCGEWKSTKQNNYFKQLETELELIKKGM